MIDDLQKALFYQDAAAQLAEYGIAEEYLYVANNTAHNSARLRRLPPGWYAPRCMWPRSRNGSYVKGLPALEVTTSHGSPLRCYKISHCEECGCDISDRCLQQPEFILCRPPDHEAYGNRQPAEGTPPPTSNSGV